MIDRSCGRGVLDGPRTLGRGALANGLLSISLGRPDLTPRLPAILCATVFVTGGAHVEWTPAHATETVRMLSHGHAVTVPDTACA